MPYVRSYTHTEKSQRPLVSSIPFLLLAVFIPLTSTAVLFAYLSSIDIFRLTALASEFTKCTPSFLTPPRYTCSPKAHPCSAQPVNAGVNKYLDFFIPYTFKL